MEASANNFLPPPSAVTEGLEPEAKITDFDQIATLGVGGYGKVNLYKHKVTGAQYAIKLTDKTKFENKLQKELFAREVEMMYKIKHPNIVRLFTHFEDESNCYIAMEYIRKGNLYSYTQSMPNKVLDAATTAHFVVDLVSALYYLHNMDPPIIHRDIKPENLLVADNGELKLTDFGGSNYLDNNKVRYTTCGTQIYHSPEMLLKKGYDTRVDVWAVGVLIFELMVGRPPFRQDSHSIEDNIVNLRIDWPPTMNLLAKNLISKILKKDPDQRPTLKEILEHQFILNYVQNPTSKLILPSEVIIKPYVISKQLPGQEYKSLDELNSNSNNNNANRSNSENEEYKNLYEKLKIMYEKLAKSMDELKIKKQETDNKNNQEIKYLKQSKASIEAELDKRVRGYFDLTKKIAEKDEEIKNLKQQKDILSQKLSKIEKELKISENKSKMKLEAYKDEIKLYQEKLNDISKGTFDPKNYANSNFQELSEDNLLLETKRENDKLKKLNSKSMTIIEDLKGKISNLEEDLKDKESKGNSHLLQLLKETEIELDKKNRKLEKMYNVMSNISSFMNKIKMNNYTFTYDGANINNLSSFRSMISNNAMSNTGNIIASKDDENSSTKRSTHVQSVGRAEFQSKSYY